MITDKEVLEIELSIHEKYLFELGRNVKTQFIIVVQERIHKIQNQLRGLEKNQSDEISSNHFALIIKPLEWYEIKGRGTCVLVDLKLNDLPYESKEELLGILTPGLTVIIGGYSYILKGIETFAVPHLPYGRVGLLITPTPISA